MHKVFLAIVVKIKHIANTLNLKLSEETICNAVVPSPIDRRDQLMGDSILFFLFFMYLFSLFSQFEQEKESRT